MRLLFSSIVALACASALACATPHDDDGAEASDDALTLKGPRSGGTVSVLSDGRWLLVGGIGSGGDPVLTEIVDPAGNVTKDGPRLTMPRSGHTATVLADGRVLVVGGGRATASVEIVDVQAGTSTPKASLPVGRMGHTATRLADGRVFVAGGYNQYGGPVPGTALYDPAADAWQPGPSLDVPRGDHTATLLPDGTVLVVGGRSSVGAALRPLPIASIERFDPRAGKMRSAGGLGYRRFSHSATLLPDGSVLVVGGETSDGVVTDTAERLRPDDGISEPAPPSGVARAEHRAIVVGGKIVVVGGRSDGVDSDRTAQIYDPASRAWQLPIPLAGSRTRAFVEVSGGRPFACAGSSRGPDATSCEEISLARRAALPALSRVSKLALEGRSSGGGDGAASWHAASGGPSALVFDDARGTTMFLSTPKAEGAPQATYAWNGGAVVELAPASASPSPSRRDFALASDRGRGRVVLFGGERRSKFNLNETWEWDGVSWKNVTPAAGSPPPRVHAQMTYDSKNRRVLLFGGRNNEGGLTDLWAWDGAAWTELAIGATVRPPESGFGQNTFAFDEARGVAVLALRSSSGSSGTWEWDGTAWRRSSAVAAPDTTTLVYDPDRGAIVALATTNACTTPGRGEPSSRVLRWDGHAWSDVLAGFSASASGCVGPVYAAYDRARRRVVYAGQWQVHATAPFGELFAAELPNRAPKILETVLDPGARAYAEAPITVRVRAEDPDGHAITFSADGLPSGAVMEGDTIRWTPTATQLGPVTFDVVASDGVRFAARKVTLDVTRFDSSLFPAGAIALRADVSWSGSTEDCGGIRGCRRSSGNSGRAACSLTGQNPGRVVVSCSGQTSYSWEYDRQNHVWGTNHETVTGASGEVASNGVSWRAGGGVRAGSFSMSGTIRKDAHGDLELCVGEVSYHANSSLRASYTGGCSPLYPVP